MDVERQQRRVLTRHFFGAFLDNDLISPGSDLHGVLSKLAALLVIPSVIYPFRLLFTYGRPFPDYVELDRISWADKSIFVTLSLVIMGLLTVVEWDALLLDRRDSAVLGPLPIRSSTILWAKLAALAKFVLVFSIPLPVAGAVIFAFVMHSGSSAGLTATLMTMAAHAVATSAAAVFAFFALLALQATIQLVFGQRLLRSVSAWMQVVLMLGLVVALLVLPFIASNTAALKQSASGLAGYAPQMWFLGIYETLCGQGDDGWRLLAWRGVIGLMIAALVAVGTSIAAYRRVLGSTLEAVQSSSPRPSWSTAALGAAAGIVARNPVERGFFGFTVLTLLRSPWHRVLMAAFFGGAMALAVVTLDLATLARDGVQRVPMVVAHGLAMQWVVLGLLLTGVRAAAVAPAELRSSWTLRMVDSRQPHIWMAGFRKAVFGALVVPVIVVMCAVVGMEFGWHAAWTHAVASLMFAALAFEVLFLGFGKVPFACAFEGASGTVKVRWYLLAAWFTTSVVGLAKLVTLVTQTTAGSLWMGAFTLLSILALRSANRRDLARSASLVFEQKADTTQALGLSNS